MDDLAPTGGDVESRLARLEDERGILRTLHHYGHCMDYGLEDQYLELFTADASRTVVATDGSLLMQFTGRDELAGHIAGHTRAPASRHKHLMYNPLITFVGPDEATVVSYSVRLDAEAGKAVVSSFGRYFDRMVKIGGRWLFAERRSELEFHRTT